MGQKRGASCYQQSHEKEHRRSPALIVGTAPGQLQTAKETRGWPWRLADVAHLLHDPSLAIASLVTLLEVAGQNERWYDMLGLALTNLLVVRLIVWLTTMAVLYSLVLLHEAWKRSTSGRTYTKRWR
jgi:hypothetical protein